MDETKFSLSLTTPKLVDPVFADSTPNPALRRTLPLPTGDSVATTQEKWLQRVLDREARLETAQTALETFEDTVISVTLDSDTDGTGKLLALLTAARDRAVHELNIARGQLERLKPSDPVRVPDATPVAPAAPKPSAVRYQDYPNKHPYMPFSIACPDVGRFMETAAVYFNTAQPSPPDVHTRLLMLTRAMATTELTQLYSGWLTGNPKATWADAGEFLQSKVPWTDVPVNGISEVIVFPPMLAHTTALSLTTYLNAYTTMLAQQSLDTSLDAKTGTLPDRHTAGGALSTSFLALDRLLARNLVLKLSPTARDAYEAFRAHEGAAQRKAGHGYMAETLSSVLQTCERLHFAKPAPGVKSLISDSGGGRFTGIRGGRGGRGGSAWAGADARPSSRPASPEGDDKTPTKTSSGCFHCASLSHFARECPKLGAKGLSRKQFTTLAVVGTQKHALQQGLAHQRAGLKLNMIGHPGHVHKAEAEANIAAIAAEVSQAQEEYSDILARFCRDNQPQA